MHTREARLTRKRDDRLSTIGTSVQCALGGILMVIALVLGSFESTLALADAQEAQVATLVINEIHYKPAPVTEWIEFVEITNPGSTPIDASGWLLDGGIDYLFPQHTVVMPGKHLVIAQSPDRFQAKYGWWPLGPFAGKLDNDGDSLLLRNDHADIMDRVDYEHGFPWPTAGASDGHSIQLINAGLDNGQAGAWRANPPTPGNNNGSSIQNAPPFVDDVTHRPQAPRANEDVTVNAQVTDIDGIDQVTLFYQVVVPGSYIPIHAPAYATQWTALPMAASEDDRWEVTLPAALQQHRHLVRYRIVARDRAGNEVRVPYADDPQPNFAYFVYNDLPTWTASWNGLPAYQHTFDFNQIRPLPVYHFIADSHDVADALFMPPSTRDAGYEGNDYLWRGTLVYGSEVYDHVAFRARGGVTRYATGKTKWKIDFLPGHRFQAYDDYGRPYPVKWDKLNLASVLQQSHRGQRGEQGMFEAMSFRLFNLAGVEGPSTHFAHLRVIDDREETGLSQFEGDFWGLYLAVEQMDGRFLDAHELPDGNLYKIDIDGPDKNNQGASSDSSQNDVGAFMHNYAQPGTSDAWWRTNLDLDRYYSYRAILEAVHHYDVDEGKNYFYYLNPEDGRWSVHPWDVDLTWSIKMPGSGIEPFYQSVLGRASFQLDYQNRLRELRDLLFNSDQISLMLDEYAGFIDTPTHVPAMVDADRFLWDYHPIYATRYVDSRRTWPGAFYQAAPVNDFSGMVTLMKQWVVERSAWIDNTLLTDTNQPNRPAITFTGTDGFAADELHFRAGEFQDPQGAQTFAAVEWRVAEISDPNSPLFDPAAPRLYEIDALARSGELTTLPSTWSVPPGLVQAQHTYRVRARMKDNSGRWSHWSQPIQFVAAAPRKGPVDSLKITEIMYHPPSLGPRPGEDFEFVELTNLGSVPIDLSNMYFSEGIRYRFAEGVQLQPGQRLVLAGDRAAFKAAYGVTAFDQYDKQLDNGGERLTLVDGYARTVVTIDYGDETPWPQSADGDGYSLVPLDERAYGADAAHWRASTPVGGSPGMADPLPVVINELLSNAGSGAPDRIELYNPSSVAANIGHWFLSQTALFPHQYRISAETTVPPGGYLVLSQQQLRATADQPAVLDISAAGGQLYLSSADETGRSSRYRHGFTFGAAEEGVSFGRVRTKDGREHFVAQERTTFGEANAEPKVGPIVFAEINYHPAKGDEYIELVNVSDQTVLLYDPIQPLRTWQIPDILYRFPTGLQMAPGEHLLITPQSPTEVCLLRDPAASGTDETTRVVGPYPLPLLDSGQSLTLARPAGPDPASGLITVDRVDYEDSAPWPIMAAGQGAALRRVDLTGFGNDPENWQERIMSDAVQAADSSMPYAGLCSFEVYRVPVELVGESGEEQTGQGTAAGDRQTAQGVAIHWISHTERSVAAYRLWRSFDGKRESAQLVREEPVPALGVAEEPAHYQLLDQAANIDDQTVYWLEAVSEAGIVAEVAFTQPRAPYHELYVPGISTGR